MENIHLKTGFDTVESNTVNNDEYLHILSLLTVFMENALQNAATYTKHANRTIVTAYDISLALKREVFEFLNSNDLEIRAKEILDNYLNEIDDEENNYSESDNSTSSDDNDDVEDNENKKDSVSVIEKKNERESTKHVNSKKTEPLNNFNCDDFTEMESLEDIYDDEYLTDETETWTKSTCECKICTEINKYKIQWKSWKPTNKIEQILYNGIIKIEDEFDLE